MTGNSDKGRKQRGSPLGHNCPHRGMTNQESRKRNSIGTSTEVGGWEGGGRERGAAPFSPQAGEVLGQGEGEVGQGGLTDPGAD